MDCTFEEYCINIGIRSLEYTHDVSTIMKHIDFLRDCHRRDLSAYKALLFLQGHIDNLAGRNSIQPTPEVPIEFVRWYTGKPKSLIIADIERWKDEEGISKDS